MIRTILSEQQWERIAPELPGKAGDPGATARDNRLFVEAVLWIARTGAPWRDLPERFGPCKTVFDYYSNWRKSGVFDRVLEALQIRLDREGKIDWDLWCIDGAHVRAARCAAGAEKKVRSGTRTKASRRTTRWAAAAADSAASSTWSLTATALRWQ